MIYEGKVFHTFVFSVICGLLFSIYPIPAIAQSQALNGQIEGTVLDQNNAAVQNAVITVTNIETGATRTVTTDGTGVYRFPLLPLGTYRITAEARNFKRYVRDGITLATGQAATVDIKLEPGEIEETVTVSGDASVADSGRTELGRVMNTLEVQNLPLVVRNPYQLGRLQANVNGRWNRGSGGFPLFNANGYLRRVNYQIDGNTNTTGGRGSVRFFIISDTYIKEVQLITNGFAAEFGNTPGMIMNVITPSGSNKFSGAVSYFFRRPTFYTRPFFFSAPALPDSKADNFTAAVGGPIIKDRWHFYFGYEEIGGQNNASADRLLAIRPEERDRLIVAGLSPSIFPAVVPSSESGSYYIVRSDIQLNDKNRVAIRFNLNDGISPNFNAIRLNTLERSADAFSKDHALAVQLASYTPRLLNEFRFQYAQRRASSFVRNATSGTGPSVTITGVAGFGSPLGEETIFPTHRITQFQENLTRTSGKHAAKFGGGVNIYSGIERSPVVAAYTFSSIDSYIAARNGTRPYGYQRYEETFGEPGIPYKATFWNFFVQDEWKVTRRLKVNYGLRYDLYRIPKADPASPLPASRKFNLDENNFAPRLGVVYALREGPRPTILRGGAGVYYDAPLLRMYQRALQNNGNSRFLTVSFTPASPNAPAFPNTFFGNLPPGSVLLPPDIDAVAPDFENMYAIHSNIQLEQVIANDLSVSIGYVHSGGRHIPVYRNINPINPVGSLADGRPVFSAVVNAATRLDPRFNIIQMVEAAGVSGYDALNLQLTQRFSRGLQFSAHYTLSKATDDAPEQNLVNALTVQGFVLSDPTNRSRDKGYSFADQRHTFIMSMVARPQFDVRHRGLRYILNNNQIGFIANANSGERFNIISALDLNRDGISTSDRPVGIKRNSGTTPPQFNVDLRYSRFFNFTERYKLEVLGEFQNLLNVRRILSFNNTTVTTNDMTGGLTGALPDFLARNQSVAQESRQIQIGLKFLF